jgi:tRNA dimethylallyltransferase
VVIGGSTASGKSALALKLAQRWGGTIVNADSQQLYRDLPILSARPTPEDEVAAPHLLYGVLGPDEQASVGRWLELIAPVLANAIATDNTLILTGGTGLYIEALLHGLPAIPPVDPEVRRTLRASAVTTPAPNLHARLAAIDPLAAGRLAPTDTQRILRALEVVESTGRSLADWQQEPRSRLLLPARVTGVALLPPAAVVAPRIENRLRAMLQGGALQEMATLLQARPELATLPVAKLHGCRELVAVQESRLGIVEAQARIAAQVRQYAKRQRTYFRHRLPELTPIAAVAAAEAVLLSRRPDH